VNKSLAAVLGGILVLCAAPALAQDRPVDVSSVEVTADVNVRLSVVLGGDVAPDVVVVSAPLGLTCGGAAFQYTPKENRQCWLWVRRNRPVLLSAQGTGRYGIDWKVRWVGCEPIDNGPVCRVTPGEEVEVAAIITRSPTTP